MARRSLRWLHKRGLKHYTVPLAILCTTLLKLAIGTGSYSGECDASRVLFAMLSYQL